MKWILSLTMSLLSLTLAAQSFSFNAMGAPTDPKVDLRWNRYYDHAQIGEVCKQLAQAHPNLIKTSSIGKSFEGKDLWLMTVTDFTTGDPNRKPGFYIDGNIHSNEIQGSEFAMYTAWYLAENFENVAFIKELLQDKVFYIIPTINPDARDNFLHEPNTASSPRSGMIPIDDDGDGLYDEDGYDDLDGNGHITLMRRKSPNGRWKADPDDPRRMISVAAGEQGEYEYLGSEGIDNDGDGRINEDRTGYYDPNRDWAWGWQPDYIQRGAYKYPFSIPENRAVMEFVMKHPNIAGAQSYHNSGGMILRGPGGKEYESTYTRSDVAVYDALGKKGEEMLPGYRYMVIYKDLYSAYGGEVDWFYGGRGIFSFTNELWTSFYLYNKKERSQSDSYTFDKYLLFEEAFVPWTPYQHPQYGEIEIGGFKKMYGRANPSFLLENDAHRNMAFTIYHAYHTPKLDIQEITTKDLGGGLTEVTAVVKNHRLIPTHASHDITNKITRPDYVTLSGRTVLAGMVVLNKDMNLCQEQKYTPHQIEVATIPSMGTATVRWIVKGKGDITITVDSEKGGIASKKL